MYPDALVLADGMTGRELTRIALGAAFLARYRHRYFVIHRRDLHGAMLEACRARGEIALEAAKGIVRFDDRGERVIAFCEDGSEYEGAALIGADGLWSPTRAAVIGDGAPRMAGHFVYRGVVPVENIIDRSHQDSMIIYAGPNLHLVQYRLRGGTVMNNVATIASHRYARGEKDCGGPDELAEMFAALRPARAADARLRRQGAQLGAARSPAGIDLVEGQRDAARRRRAPHAAIPRAGRLHGDRGRGRARREGRRARRGFQPRLRRLPAGALLPHGARADHCARLRRDPARRRWRARAAQPPVRCSAIRTFPAEVDWLYRGITLDTARRR